MQMASDALNEEMKGMAVQDTFVNSKAQPSTADTVQHTKEAVKEHRYGILLRVMELEFSLSRCLI